MNSKWKTCKPNLWIDPDYGFYWIRLVLHVFNEGEYWNKLLLTYLPSYYTVKHVLSMLHNVIGNSCVCSCVIYIWYVFTKCAYQQLWVMILFLEVINLYFVYT